MTAPRGILVALYAKFPVGKTVRLTDGRRGTVVRIRAIFGHRDVLLEMPSGTLEWARMKDVA